MAFGKLGAALTAREIQGLVAADLEQVEAFIADECVGSVEQISEIARYLHSAGGKRIRPTLLLLSTRLFTEPNRDAIQLAAVVEMIHAATLVHDDVIDVATTRRGRPSANVIWGNHASVLAGDWMYMQAFQVALRMRNFHVLDVLIGLTQLMVEGELIQLQRIGRIDVSETDYMELIDRKTAALFSACARLGAVAGGADEAVESRLSEFAWNLGMAFQLVDDLLDFTAREKVLGKPVGNDLQEGKVTLPLIYALEDATPQERQDVETVLRDGNYSRVPLSRIQEFIRERRGLARARERANFFTERARTLIATFPESRYQEALAAVTDLVTERES
ncbi:MAG: polyprenyl synthetase family protein [Bryobacteraceae bacterium]|nr:polyprenyl synthetase family protein [Bryobacteraceae bacterium]